MNDSQLSSTEPPSLESATAPLFPLRVAAQLSNTPVSSLRKYVDRGLIIPYRTSTNRYLYSRVDIQRLRCIRTYLDEQRLNLAGILALFAQVPCWLIRPCSQEDWKACEAYDSASRPCWQVTRKGPECQQADCRICSVYRLPEKCTDIKSIFKGQYLKIANPPQNK